MAIPIVAAEAATGAGAASAAAPAAGAAEGAAAGRGAGAARSSKVVRDKPYAGGSSMATQFPSGRRAGAPAPKPADQPPADQAPAKATASSKPAGGAPAGEREDQGAQQPAGDRGGRRWSLPGGDGGNVGGFILGLLVYGWVALPLLTGGPTAVKNVWRAKFFNKGPKGEWLP